MVVLIANTTVTARVRAHAFQRDARGVPMPTAADTITERGPYPGAADEQPDASWVLRLDPGMHPLRAGDEIIETGGLRRVWVLEVEPKPHFVPGYPAADFIEATGILNPPRTP